MPEVTNELMYELLKRMNHRLEKVEHGIGDIRKEMFSMRGHMLSIQTDPHNIYGILDRNDDRLDRIERRVDLRELAEPQRPFDPQQ